MLMICYNGDIVVVANSESELEIEIALLAKLLSKM